MDLQWTGKAVSDLLRLYAFMASENEQAAATMMQRLTKAPSTLLTHPRIGEQLFQFEPREVRRWLVGSYEMRYEVRDPCIYILRVWHTREHR